MTIDIGDTVVVTPPESGEAGDSGPGWRPYGRLSVADQIFAWVARLSGAVVLGIMGLVGVFLAGRAWLALSDAGFRFFTVQAWEPDSGNFGVAGILVGTILIGLLAICMALPLALATALYISEYAPARLKRTFISAVDLMAAVPSVVFGLWGVFFLQEHAVSALDWFTTYFRWIPLFDVPAREDPHDPLRTLTDLKSSTFMAAMVVGMMVTPIACSIMREAFAQAPVGEREGALALGATRWGMIRSVVLPYGRGAIIGGTMLGLGRALGETITVAMIISPVFVIQPHVLYKGGISVSSLIALQYGTASPFAISALFAAGFVLFLMTMAVNFLAATFVSRSRSGAASEA
ncbi:phosphate ABC transporter permease subunit PstC [Spongisporangium articulatum]|uniref:Phosphate transport system permease protein n=1 Tax=Spongisporangium articulatum TaxID=3362603 RepID=A0ABW8AHP1_9ACTN